MSPRKKGEPYNVTEMKARYSVPQKLLAEIVRYEGVLRGKIEPLKRKVGAMLDRGGSVEPGPLKVRRGPKGEVIIYRKKEN